MNNHEKRLWRLLFSLGARETRIGGKLTLNLSWIRLTEGKNFSLFYQAVDRTLTQHETTSQVTPSMESCPPNEGAKITHYPAADTWVYLSTREVKRRSLREPLHEAELRESIGTTYVPVGRVFRPTRHLALKAALALARRRNWYVHGRCLRWKTREDTRAREIGKYIQDNTEEVACTKIRRESRARDKKRCKALRGRNLETITSSRTKKKDAES